MNRRDFLIAGVAGAAYLGGAGALAQGLISKEHTKEFALLAAVQDGHAQIREVDAVRMYGINAGGVVGKVLHQEFNFSSYEGPQRPFFGAQRVTQVSDHVVRMDVVTYQVQGEVPSIDSERLAGRYALTKRDPKANYHTNRKKDDNNDAIRNEIFNKVVPTQTNARFYDTWNTRAISNSVVITTPGQDLEQVTLRDIVQLGKGECSPLNFGGRCEPGVDGKIDRVELYSRGGASVRVLNDHKVFDYQRQFGSVREEVTRSIWDRLNAKVEQDQRLVTNVEMDSSAEAIQRELRVSSDPHFMSIGFADGLSYFISLSPHEFSVDEKRWRKDLNGVKYRPENISSQMPLIKNLQRIKQGLPKK